MKSPNFYLHTLNVANVAKLCSYSEHLMVTADDKDCIHYFNNVIILLFYSDARTEAGVGTTEQHFEQLLN